MTIIEKEIDEGKDEKVGDIVKRNGNAVIIYGDNKYYSLEEGEVYIGEQPKERICSECDNKPLYDSEAEEFYCPRCDK